MEHFIALSVKQDSVPEGLPRLWYKTATDHLPSGLACTFARGDEQIKMAGKTADGKTTYTIPLTRDPTEKEVTKVVTAFDAAFEGDYSISSSKIEVGLKKQIEVEVPHDPLIELCTAWAKQQHDDWVKDKLDAGWRYGTSVSATNKTHPLLRSWSDLPEAYRVVDTSRPEELLKLFNQHGYVLVRRDELDQLVKGSKSA